MKKKILILLALFISTQIFAGIGSNGAYSIITQENYNNKILKGYDLVLQRYIVVPSMDKQFKNLFETTDEQQLLAKFSYMLYKNKARWIEKYIKDCDNNLDINNLIKGMYFFSTAQYPKAVDCLQNYKGNANKFLQLLLIADCKYEMLSNKSYYKIVIEDYQLALDNADSEQNKMLVKNRIKFIRYQ